MSKISEMNSRPATLSLSTRVDLRHLATIASFWQKQGEHPRSISELVRLTLEGFAEVLVVSGQVDFINGQTEAQEYMASLGLSLKMQTSKLVDALKREGIHMIPTAQHGQMTLPGHSPSNGAVISGDHPSFLEAQKRFSDLLRAGLSEVPPPAVTFPQQDETPEVE